MTSGTYNARGATPADPRPVATAGTEPAIGPLRTSSRFRLRGRAYKTALTAHILVGGAWFGIAVIVAFCAIAAVTTGNQALPHVFFTMMQTVPWVSVPVGLLTVVTGVILGLGTAHGLIRQWWVVAKIVIAAAVILADSLIIGPAAQHAVRSGHASVVLLGATYGHVGVLAAAIVLGVFKPRARTPWGRQRGGPSRGALRSNHPTRPADPDQGGSGPREDKQVNT